MSIQRCSVVSLCTECDYAYYRVGSELIDKRYEDEFSGEMSRTDDKSINISSGDMDTESE